MAFSSALTFAGLNNEGNCLRKISNLKVGNISDLHKHYGEGTGIYWIWKNVIKNISKLKKKEKIIIGFGAPAKATTALNFFGIKKEINYIVEDNNLKHNKIVPGVDIPIFSKSKIKEKNPAVIVLAWNFFEDIKSNNKKITEKFINIKDLENKNFN